MNEVGETRCWRLWAKSLNLPVGSDASRSPTAKWYYRIPARPVNPQMFSAMSPQNESPNVYPYYRREFMRGNVAPLKTVTRYVAPVIPRW